MSFLTIHTRCLSVRDPWGTYLSMHLSRRTTRPSIIVTFAARDYVPRNIISIAARDTTLEMVHPLTTTMFQVQCKLHAQMKNEEITILIPKLNLQQGIQHQQISNKSPNHSQHHTRKYTNFIRLTRV